MTSEERDPAPRTDDPVASFGALSDADGPSVVVPPPDYSAQGVPSLDFVRDKIEGRYAQSLGSAELASETPEARSAAEQQQDREQTAKDRLDAIRRSLREGTS